MKPKVKRTALPLVALALTVIALLCFGGLLPNIDGTIDDYSREVPAFGFVACSCAALAFCQLAFGLPARRIIMACSAMLVVFSFIALSLLARTASRQSVQRQHNQSLHRTRYSPLVPRFAFDGG